MNIKGTSDSRFRSLVGISFLLLVFLLMFLPTGSIFGINVKVASLGAFMCLFVVYLAHGLESFSWEETFFLITVCTFLGIWTLNGALNGTMDIDQVGHQLRDISTTILIASLSAFFIGRQIVRAERLVTTIIWAVFALSAMKLVLIAVPFISNIDIIEGVRSIFGESSFVSGDIAFGLFRVQFSADIVTPFAVFALLAPSVSGVKFGRGSTILVFTVVVISSFIAFSRYIWFLLAIAVFAAIVIERNWKLPLIFALAALILGTSFTDFFNTAGQARFVSDASQISDDMRFEQSKALTAAFLRRPFWGAGIGAHTNAVIRDETLSYSYELQWLAFLMQFGILGMVGILLLIGFSAHDLISANHPARLWLAILFFLWLASGFTNPYLTSSFSGGTFSLFLALFHRLRNSDPTINATMLLNSHQNAG